MPVNHVAMVTLDAEPEDQTIEMSIARYTINDAGDAIERIAGWDGSQWVPNVGGRLYSMIKIRRHDNSEVWIGGPAAVDMPNEPQNTTKNGYFAEIFTNGRSSGTATFTLNKRSRMSIAVAITP